MIYMDNAATSFPKAPGVPEAVAHYLSDIGASPGRGGHQLGRQASGIVQEAREGIARFFNAPEARHVVFTLNLTEAINLALNGFLREGDHVVTTSVEHNAVMRPLRHLEKDHRIDLTVLPCHAEGCIDLQDLREEIRPDTALVVINHASNVLGSVQPLGEIGKLVEDIPLLVDAAQTGGIIPIDFEAYNISMLAFSGHKSFMGPPGVGGLIIREGLERRLEPLIRGGTGSRSEDEDQPDFCPDRYESGTPNTAGLAGFNKALAFVESTGTQVILRHELELMGHLLDGLRQIDGVQVHGPRGLQNRVPLVSLSVKGVDNAILGQLLWQEFNIATRVGLHCSPAAHLTAGTYPAGTVRLSPGYFSTEGEVNQVLEAIASVVTLPGKVSSPSSS
ncbi:MAG: aminotransferase class V-fold PLP-dependent enzyme [Deltaproteobacteria bacterium]|nr:aminotransferase class V-fold PLP-dependent enzyme [Deltaproteobacteria bacterium]MBW2307288.1 aminotransferase class V-fold PLP-dependent enzyme [Deltaproteobacteria bacterium]